VDLVVEGKRVALVSEAGMPTLSDPGFLAVRACVEAGYPAEVIPGPSALTAALSLSGYPLQRFYFAGFLPSKKGERRKLLEKLSSLEEVQVFFESPHRVRKTLEDFSSNFGERPIVLAREITKQHEEVLRGSARELLRKVEESSARGEYILILGPAVKPDKREDHALLEPLLREVEKLVQEGVSSSEACREVARREGVSRRELYNAYIKGAGDRH
jgi:16S rRNA (cytidine1402-2'-O)-methyltransferase